MTTDEELTTISTNHHHKKDPWEACLCANCGCLLKWVYDKTKRTWCDICEEYLKGQ